MKKAMLLMVAAIMAVVILGASAEEPPFLGTWVLTEQRTDGVLDLSVFTLTQDGHSYWLTYTFPNEGKESPLNHSYAGTWKVLDDGRLYVPIAEDGGNTFTLEEDGWLHSTFSYNYAFARAGSPYVEQIVAISDWIELKQGVYIIGEDVPAGKYSVIADTSTITVWVRPDHGMSSFFIVEDDFDSEARVILTDGVLEINGGDATLIPVK